MPTKKANGEGSVQKYYKNGVLSGWRCTITLGRNDNGKLVRKQFYGKTKLEALNKCQEYKNKAAAGALPSDEKITLQQWIKTWLFEYKTNELRQSTVARYEGIYRNYIKDTDIGMSKLKDLRAANLQAYYNNLIRDQNKTPDTVKTVNKVIKAALSQAIKEQYIFLNPCNHVILPKIEAKEEIEIFTLEEQKGFIKAIQDHRHRVLFLLALGTGLRIGELLGLKWSDIDINNKELTVSRTIRRVTKLDYKTGTKAEGVKTELKEEDPKTKYSARTIPIPSKLINELKLHKQFQKKEINKAKEIYVKNDLVFPNEIGEPTDARNLTRSYERLLKRANIPYKKFHALRHTFATRLFEKRVPLKTVSTLLGHSDIKITADIYTHVMPDEKINAIEQLNDLLVL